MKKVGRNAPCPCGSGKKYKMCCLKREEEMAPAPGRTEPIWIEDDLDQDSNRVVDLLEEGRIEEAEKAAALLIEKYPEVPDGLERTAAVLDAKGENAEAAKFYRRAAAKYVEQDPEEGYQLADFCLTKAEELEKKVEKEG